MLKQSVVETPQGPMIVLADETALYLLEFVGRKGLEAEIKRLHTRTKKTIITGRTAITDLIEQELQHYFAGTLQAFITPVVFVGSSFQKLVWWELQRIPFGQTRSYKEMAVILCNPDAHRAVARANATNQLALIVPCHRVVATGGGLGGYAAGVERKQWLLDHERQSI
jgi:AraC family transcriptional regulator of adaptative response/methylated-DNA-[protein]-cysteine methyltransferase